jgi:4-hydroxybenzoate polyprenyltransferase
MQTNSYSNPEENNSSFVKRFHIYQKERFPLLSHGLLIASFSFSAISYSRICRGAAGFVNWQTFLTGIFTTFSLFLLVRIADEFKDAEDDAVSRPQLPLPRGLLSFRELKIIAVVILLLQIGINLVFFPKMLLIYFFVITYLLLMSKEFFVAAWLRKHQFWYVTSHMFIIPLIDMYASGLDWLQEGVTPPAGLMFFFAVSYMNGIVIEVGRKIRIPEKETPGVLTYSSQLGANSAVILWITVLFATFCLSIAASFFSGYGVMALLILGIAFISCSLPALFFLNKKTEKRSKSIEKAAALWTITMYLALGGIPMLQQLIF